MNNQKQAALAVEGRAASRRAVLAAAALAPHAAVDGVNSGLADNSTSRFNNAVLGVQSNTDFTAGNESSIAAIAAKNAAKLAEEKANKNKKYTKTEEDIERDAENSKKLVLGIAGAGTVLSGAFIIPNLTRLATKIASGGQDDGRSKVGGKKAGRKAKPAPKQKSFGEKLFSTVFAREL